MLFNSYIFVLFFLPVVLMGYFLFNKFKKYNIAEIFLLIMSLWFYAYFNIRYIFIILFSIILNYTISNSMLIYENKIKKKILLLIGILFNVGILFYYKYLYFFITTINTVFQTSLNTYTILLPLGISFFTFQQLSYLIDSYQEKTRRYNFLEYALFVTFFPQLIAGPIVLHDEIIPQINDVTKKNFNAENFAKGIQAFSQGMAKKVLIADTLSGVVNFGYENIRDLSTLDVIIVILSYTFQIYFDFSGYCDMAIGIGKMFNIDIHINFNSPYKSLTIDEFWKRWHITLTRFLRTYIYFPLGGNKKGNFRTYINLVIVFFISGLWHGANYTFIVWGILHGVAMLFNRKFKRYINKIPNAVLWIITFMFINITWVFFRADSVGQAIEMINQLLNFNDFSITREIQNIFLLDEIMLFLTSLSFFIKITNIESLIYFSSILFDFIMNNIAYIILVFLTGLTLLTQNTFEKISKKLMVRDALFSAVILAWSILSFSKISEFLYFNF